MLAAKFFWLALTVAAVVWYTTVTLYVAIRGFWDIRSMLRELGDRRDEASDPLHR